MRTIRVTGKGQIKVKPDITRITMTLHRCLPRSTVRLCATHRRLPGGAEGRPFAFGFERI